MKIAVIGTGISGLVAAYLLQREHELTVFEAGPAIGGHTATVDVELQGETYAVDTGFIVYNDRTYPNFIRLMDELGVASQPTDMGFSVKLAAADYEYSGSSLNSLFACRRNLVSPAHWRMLRDILRFNREAVADLERGAIGPDTTLGEYLTANHYGEYFIQRYLVPMGAAIWSASTRDMRAFPLQFFVRFFKNHGLLSVNQRPQWRVLKGGSRSYLKPLTAGFAERIHTGTPVTALRRDADGAWLTSARGEERFDQVVIATHADQALAMLTDPSAAEREVLGALPYRDNDVVLHTDASVLPRRQLAWASWNYGLEAGEQARAVLTYNMNILQSLPAPQTLCVTLNNTDAIASDRILRRFNYAHPVFTVAGMQAQARWADINGVARSWYCGAYWRNGFHEDGVVSALRVCAALGVRW
ncbi:MAG TPA: FAD-dependent oxidoreductase [Spongiibacteraceae bacterium]|nr:FAD-dependent oxidoreductase [Spongiibacteraceae bacterium]HUH38063.1 FAD-dependent oxidoreductase [Spongiibacteraceae bacterium]